MAWRSEADLRPVGLLLSNMMGKGEGSPHPAALWEIDRQRLTLKARQTLDSSVSVVLINDVHNIESHENTPHQMPAVCFFAS